MKKEKTKVTKRQRRRQNGHEKTGKSGKARDSAMSERQYEGKEKKHLYIGSTTYLHMCTNE
jgi:hypothetical protein